MSVGILGCHSSGGGGATDIWWVEARDIAQHPPSTEREAAPPHGQCPGGEPVPGTNQSKHAPTSATLGFDTHSPESRVVPPKRSHGQATPARGQPLPKALPPQRGRACSRPGLRGPETPARLHTLPAPGLLPDRQSPARRAFSEEPDSLSGRPCSQHPVACGGIRRLPQLPAQSLAHGRCPQRSPPAGPGPSVRSCG